MGDSKLLFEFDQLSLRSDQGLVEIESIELRRHPWRGFFASRLVCVLFMLWIFLACSFWLLTLAVLSTFWGAVVARVEDVSLHAHQSCRSCQNPDACKVGHAAHHARNYGNKTPKEKDKKPAAQELRQKWTLLTRIVLLEQNRSTKIS